MSTPDAFMTPQIREALAKLEEAEVNLDTAIVAAKQVEQQTPKTRLSEEDIQQIEEHARGTDAPRELRELQERIDAGELSWEDIAQGRHMDDPRVQGALSTGVEGMHQAYTAIQEGQSLDEIIEAGPPVRRPDDGGNEDEGGGYSFTRFDPDDE